jgi:uncharacterized membrane protein YphA (DoxX/SURF4 family)
MKTKLSEIYWPLRVAYGLVPLLAGLDKYTNILADWERYVSPFAASLLPINVATFLHIIGIVEVIVGLTVLFDLTRLGGLVAAAWLGAARQLFTCESPPVYWIAPPPAASLPERLRIVTAVEDSRPP